MCAAVAPQTAQAQVGVTDAFLPRSWQPGAETPRSGVRARSSRRGGVTATTSLEEFDLHQRSARRTARNTGGHMLPVVERKRIGTRVRVASLGGAIPSAGPPVEGLTGGAIAWKASSDCLAGNLRSIVASLTGFGSVTVNSTCRNPGHNRRVGGARKSWHLTGNAVDFRIHGANVGRVYALLRSSVGGLKHYGGGRFHIDNGPRRSF